MTSEAPTFAPAVDHRRIDSEAWADIYVVGDVHGCFEQLRTLIERIDPDEDDLLAFVGDLVRKGPDSARVVEWVRDAPNAITVQGNNERKLLTGRATLPSLDDEQRAFLADCPHVISFGDSLVVHGGLDPSRPLEDQDPATVATMRSTAPDGGYDGPFWFEAWEGPYTVYFGHTVLERPLVRDVAVGLDTGCVYGGELTACHVGSGELTTVPGRFEAWHRDRDSIVDDDRVRSIEAGP